MGPMLRGPARASGGFTAPPQGPHAAPDVRRSHRGAVGVAGNPSTDAGRPTRGGAMRSNLFDASNQERQTNDRWALQSSKMLRCALNPQAPEIISAAGAMVAYQGQMDFSYQGSGGG